MTIPTDLIWALTKKSNAHKINRGGYVLSKDPNNASSRHRWASSSLTGHAAGVKVVDAVSKKSKKPTKKIVLTTSTKNSNKPASALSLTGLSMDKKKAFKAIDSQLSSRQELATAAKVRFLILRRSLKPKKSVGKRPRHGGN